MESVLREFAALLMPLLIGALILGVILFFLLRRRRKSEKEVINAILDAASIPFFSQNLPELAKEVARSRRFARDFSVIVVEPAHQQLQRYPSNGVSSHYSTRKPLTAVEFLLCGPAIRDEMRATDLVSFDANNNRFIIMLPETEKSNANHTIQRIRKSLGSSLSTQLAIGTATFPSDGLIVEELINQAITSTDAILSAHSDSSFGIQQDMSSR